MLKSPSEDFSSITLAAVPGSLGKLKYIAGLRQSNGEYFHWGLARSHGETNASMAIAHAHSELFTKVLRTPLPSLWEEVRSVSEQEGTQTSQLLYALLQHKEMLVPTDRRGGSARHFSSVLAGLLCLSNS